jgi:hypothetical protein
MPEKVCDCPPDPRGPLFTKHADSCPRRPLSEALRELEEMALADLEEAKARLQQVNAAGLPHQFRIARFERVGDMGEVPLPMICDVDVADLQGPRLGPDAGRPVISSYTMEGVSPDHPTIEVQRVGDIIDGKATLDVDRWAIRYMRRCWNRDGEWEWEPIPSSRDDAFKERTRFPLREALERARDARADVLRYGPRCWPSSRRGRRRARTARTGGGWCRCSSARWASGRTRPRGG